MKHTLKKVFKWYFETASEIYKLRSSAYNEI